jgi:hypothetical protein
MAKTYEPIATQTLGSATNSVTFSSIAGTYTDLKMVISCKYTTSGQYTRVRFNGDTGGNYSITTIYGDGSTVASTRESGGAIGINGFYTTDTSNFIAGLMDVMNYSNSTTFKTVLQRGTDAAARVNATVGLWRNTAAITSIGLDTPSGNYAIGSTFTLYGIKAA